MKSQFWALACALVVTIVFCAEAFPNGSGGGGGGGPKTGGAGGKFAEVTQNRGAGGN